MFGGIFGGGGGDGGSGGGSLGSVVSSAQQGGKGNAPGGNSRGGGNSNSGSSSSNNNNNSSSSNNNNNNSNNSGQQSLGFDASGLERAAAAMRELDASRNASQALRLIEEQEKTKREDSVTQREQFKAFQAQKKLEAIQKEAEESRKTLELQRENDKHREDYHDQLERRRLMEQMQAQKHLAEEERQKQDEAVQRQEAIRRKTLEYEAELRRQTEIARAQADAEGKIKLERENQHLHLEKARVEAAELRETVLSGIKELGTTVGTGLTDFLSDSDKMIAAASTVTAIVLGYYVARTSTGIAGRYIEARLGRPSLVRETSRRSILWQARHPVQSVRKLFGWHKVQQALDNMVLEPQLEARLSQIARATANTKKNNAVFRNFLLHGPPGTGKTMFARGLARNSGLDYAIMTGGDIAPLGRDAVTEVHRLFDWAQTTRRGMVLFVDEADAFLRKRSNERISEDMRNALNAFLFRTGTQSDKVSVIYASNQPEQFDWAVNDRIDDMVVFENPSFHERVRMLRMYAGQYIMDTRGRAKNIVLDEELDDAFYDRIAELTEGFSGREISKLAVSWQAAAYGLEAPILTHAMLEEVVQDHIEQKKIKLSWTKDNAYFLNLVDGGDTPSTSSSS